MNEASSPLSEVPPDLPEPTPLPSSKKRRSSSPPPGPPPEEKIVRRSARQPKHRAFPDSASSSPQPSTPAKRQRRTSVTTPATASTLTTLGSTPTNPFTSDILPWSPTSNPESKPKTKVYPRLDDEERPKSPTPLPLDRKIHPPKNSKSKKSQSPTPAPQERGSPPAKTPPAAQEAPKEDDPAADEPTQDPIEPPDSAAAATKPKQKRRLAPTLVATTSSSAQHTPAKTPASKPQLSKKARAEIRAWKPNQLLTSHLSKLVKLDVKVRDVLLHPSAWSCLSPAERDRLRALFPAGAKHYLCAKIEYSQPAAKTDETSESAASGGVGGTKGNDGDEDDDGKEAVRSGSEAAGGGGGDPDLMMLRNDDQFSQDAADYRQNLEEGRHEASWLLEAHEAHGERLAGCFEGVARRKFLHEWVGDDGCDEVQGKGEAQEQKDKEAVEEESPPAGPADEQQQKQQQRSASPKTVGEKSQDENGSAVGGGSKRRLSDSKTRGDGMDANTGRRRTARQRKQAEVDGGSDGSGGSPEAPATKKPSWSRAGTSKRAKGDTPAPTPAYPIPAAPEAVKEPVFRLKSPDVADAVSSAGTIPAPEPKQPDVAVSNTPASGPVPEETAAVGA